MEKVQHIYYVNSNFGTMWILNSITVISMKKGHNSWNKRTLGKLSHHHKTQMVHSWWLPKDCALAVRAIVMPRTVFLQISPSHISCIINVSFIRLHICFYSINNFIILTVVQRTRDIKKLTSTFITIQVVENLSRCLQSAGPTSSVPVVNQVLCILIRSIYGATSGATRKPHHKGVFVKTPLIYAEYTSRVRKGQSFSSELQEGMEKIIFPSLGGDKALKVSQVVGFTSYPFSGRGLGNRVNNCLAYLEQLDTMDLESNFCPPNMV